MPSPETIVHLDVALSKKEVFKIWLFIKGLNLAVNVTKDEVWPLIKDKLKNSQQ